MLLSPNFSVVFFCGLEQLEMAITRRRSASLTERLHLLRRHRFEAARNSHVLAQHVQRVDTDNWGTTWWIGFSPDREQKYMYVDDGGAEQVKILDHASGRLLSSFGRTGHQIGEFTHGHTLAGDSKGNVYVAETDWGRRVQKFVPVK